MSKPTSAGWLIEKSGTQGPFRKEHRRWLLAEFGSAVDAVRCAAEIQHRMLVQVPVALRRDLRRCARHRARSWRHNDRRIRMTLADLTVNIVAIVRSIAGKRRNRSRDLLKQGTDLRAVIDIVAAHSTAMICPVSASTGMWSFLQNRRALVACFSTSHSPGPQSLSPVLSTAGVAVRCRVVVAAPAMSRPVG